MSRNVLIVLGVVVLAAGGAWAFFMGPLKKEPAATTDSFDAAATDTSAVPSTSTPDCDTATTPPAGAVTPPAGATTTPGAAAPGGAVTPPPGATTTPGAAAPGGAVTPPAGAVTPPAGAVAGREASGEPVLVAAGPAGFDPTETSDSVVLHAADAGVTPPAAGAPGAAATDSGLPGGAAPPPDAADPAAAGTGDAMGGGAAPQATDPCADAAGAGSSTGAGADPLGTAGGSGAAPAAAGGAAQSGKASDGTHGGNNAEALATSKAVAAIGGKSRLNFVVETSLMPVTGGVTLSKPKVYRGTVTSATLRIAMADPASQDVWTKGAKKVKKNFVAGFLTFLDKRFPKAVRSVTVVDSTGTILAVGDAGAAGAGRITVVR